MYTPCSRLKHPYLSQHVPDTSIHPFVCPHGIPPHLQILPLRTPVYPYAPPHTPCRSSDALLRPYTLIASPGNLPRHCHAMPRVPPEGCGDAQGCREAREYHELVGDASFRHSVEGCRWVTGIDDVCGFQGVRRRCCLLSGMAGCSGDDTSQTPLRENPCCYHPHAGFVCCVWYSQPLAETLVVFAF